MAHSEKLSRLHRHYVDYIASDSDTRKGFEHLMFYSCCKQDIIRGLVVCLSSFVMSLCILLAGNAPFALTASFVYLVCGIGSAVLVGCQSLIRAGIFKRRARRYVQKQFKEQIQTYMNI